MVTFGNMKAHIFTVLTLTLCSLASSAQTFNDGTAGLTKKREIKQARKAHYCKLIGDMHRNASIYLDLDPQSPIGEMYGDWLFVSMEDMFEYRNAYWQQLIYNSPCGIDMKMMQDATTELVVSMKFDGAEYSKIRAVDTWRDFFYGIY